jgi:hypothetical protein
MMSVFICLRFGMPVEGVFQQTATSGERTDHWRMTCPVILYINIWGP